MLCELRNPTLRKDIGGICYLVSWLRAHFSAYFGGFGGFGGDFGGLGWIWGLILVVLVDLGVDFGGFRGFGW